MNIKGLKKTRLAKGQVWKTGAADIEIVALGKRKIHYKVEPQFGIKRVSAQISGIEALANYLHTTGAQLAPRVSSN